MPSVITAPLQRSAASMAASSAVWACTAGSSLVSPVSAVATTANVVKILSAFMCVCPKVW
jgi:hypothetical protein